MDNDFADEFDDDEEEEEDEEVVKPVKATPTPKEDIFEQKEAP